MEKRINDDEYLKLVDGIFSNIQALKERTRDFMEYAKWVEDIMRNDAEILLDYVVEEETEEKVCYVYFIENSYRDQVKIGITNNVKNRMSALMTSCGDEVILHHCFECKSREEAFEIESLLHEYYRFARLKRKGDKKPSEWFSIERIEKEIKFGCTYPWEEITSAEIARKVVELTEENKLKAMSEEMNRIKIFV